jgi:hypothetical protein
LVYLSGGINNEVYLSERMMEKFHENGAMGFVEVIRRINGARALFSYWEVINGKEKEEKAQQERLGIDANSDPISILACYKLSGLLITQKDMEQTGTISTWLSGMTYSHIIALWNFAWDKHLYCARPLEFFGFAVPDTFPYLTTKGISYKVVSGYRLDEKIRILFGFEHVFVGIPETEYMLGIRHQLGEVYRNVSYKVVTVFGKQGINLESSCSIPIGSFSFTAGFNTYASQSLLGERHSMDLRKKQSHTAYVSVAYVY